MAKTKICKYCRSEIDAKAKICPNCRRKQGGGCGTIFLAIILVIVIGFALMVLLSIIGGAEKAANKKQIQTEAEQMTEDEYKSKCKNISYEEIARDKEGLKGEKVSFTGEVIQATSGVYRMNITKTDYSYTDTIIFEVDEEKLKENILEDDIITIWGESEGLYTYKAVLGNEITVPRVQVIYIENHGKEEN